MFSDLLSSVKIFAKFESVTYFRLCSIDQLYKHLIKSPAPIKEQDLYLFNKL
jgi:hypothetical protein